MLSTIDKADLTPEGGTRNHGLEVGAEYIDKLGARKGSTNKKKRKDEEEEEAINILAKDKHIT